MIFKGVPGEPVEIHSEREIFDYLDYPYKEPNERNWRGNNLYSFNKYIICILLILNKGYN